VVDLGDTTRQECQASGGVTTVTDLSDRSAPPLDARRELRIEQASETRYHHRTRIERPSELSSRPMEDIQTGYHPMA
jgi:hypothetical protein